MTLALLTRIQSITAGSPDAVAVVDGASTLTRGELWERSGALAERLAARGVGAGDLVGQCLGRSAALVVSTVGILRAGATSVAIDPSYPAERIRWILDDAAVAAVVAGAGELPQASGRPVVPLAPDGRLDEPAVPGGARPPHPVAGSDAAYVVYTSGSTGRPKGVVVEHAALANLVDWHVHAFGLGAGDRGALIASPGFDASVWELWPSLVTGGTLHVVPDELRADPGGLRDWLVAQAISVCFVPTALADELLALRWPGDVALRFLLTGGDALSRRPAPELPFAVVNNYGLSETAVVATSGRVAPGGTGPPSIGRAIAGAITEVVDADLEPVGPGEDGELLIGGAVLAGGYLGDDELTRERFVETPRGRRLRSGDRVRRRADGELDFVGRIDDQLSVRGFRVEPGEIAAALNAHPAVEASVAVATAEGNLVGYVVPATTDPPPPEALTEFLAGVVPTHMIPSRFRWLPALPVTAHGKIDRDALPPLDAVASSAGEAAQTPTEGAIAAIVCDLLELDAIGPADNVFLLGGHSLFGAQLIVRLADRFDVEVSLRFLFDHPTVAALAAEVERQQLADPVSG